MRIWHVYSASNRDFYSCYKNTQKIHLFKTKELKSSAQQIQCVYRLIMLKVFVIINSYSARESDYEKTLIHFWFNPMAYI